MGKSCRYVYSLNVVLLIEINLNWNSVSQRYFPSISLSHCEVCVELYISLHFKKYVGLCSNGAQEKSSPLACALPELVI